MLVSSRDILNESSEDDRTMCDLYVWCGPCEAFMYDVWHEYLKWKRKNLYWNLIC